MAHGLIALEGELHKTRAPEAINRTVLHRPEDMLPAPRILIVDDNDEDTANIKRVLRAPGSTLGRLKCKIESVRDVVSARSYLRDDSIDIYFLDLDIWECEGEGLGTEIGKAFVRDVVDGTNAGIIVCSVRAMEKEGVPLLEYGADDYVDKSFGYEIIPSRTLSLWRRALLNRPSNSHERRPAHLGRAFLLGNWRFVVGNRIVTNKDGGSIKLSITEHAFLRHICVVDDHMINSDILNIEVLGRDSSRTQVRLDNFVDRLRERFSETLELYSQGRNGFYKLLNVQELKPIF